MTHFARPIILHLLRVSTERTAQGNGRTREAFDSLYDVGTQYWDNAQFLVVLLDLAFGCR